MLQDQETCTPAKRATGDDTASGADTAADLASALIALIAGAGVLAIGLWLSWPGHSTYGSLNAGRLAVEEPVLFSAPGPERAHRLPVKEENASAH